MKPCSLISPPPPPPPPPLDNSPQGAGPRGSETPTQTSPRLSRTRQLCRPQRIRGHHRHCSCSSIRSRAHQFDPHQPRPPRPPPTSRPRRWLHCRRCSRDCRPRSSPLTQQHRYHFWRTIEKEPTEYQRNRRSQQQQQQQRQ